MVPVSDVTCGYLVSSSLVGVFRNRAFFVCSFVLFVVSAGRFLKSDAFIPISHVRLSRIGIHLTNDLDVRKRIRGTSFRLNLISRDETMELNETSSLTSFDSTKDFEESIVIEYSVNFQRHVAKQRKDGNWIVLESFWWLDEAIVKYPRATLLTLSDENNPYVTSDFVAGDVVSIQQSYPRNESQEFNNPSDIQSINYQRVREVLTDVLKWYPNQVEDLFQRWPPLYDYPAHELDERIRFLLAPLPNETVLASVNITDDIDWPKLFHNPPDGVPCGAGMSVTQVSHALQVLPEPFILRLKPFPKSNGATGMDGRNIMNSEKLLDLYDQTPSVVLQMTHSVLDLWVSGSNSYESVALAYLHWRGWEWNECRVMLHAFPSVMQCRLEPSWELYERGNSGSCRSSIGVRKLLIAEALEFLQMRLHLRPWHIQAMLKTHPRLTGYSATSIIRNIDYLQRRLCLTSADVRSIILLMPSLLGASTESLDTRIEFLLIAVGLTLPQLRSVIVRKPALLQYSVENNLQTKIDFYTTSLSIQKESLASMTIRNPTIWGRSFDRYLRPTAVAFCDYLEDMTLAEYGQIISQVPEILHCRWNGNLREKMVFLENRLNLSKKEMKQMVIASPRILLQAIPTSLEPKIGMLEAVDSCGSRVAFLKNPSLLLNSKSGLQRRVQRLVDNPLDISLADALTGSSPSRNRRRHRGVVLVCESGDLEFSTVSAAALHAGISVSNMYKVLRNNRTLDGDRYMYANMTTDSHCEASTACDCLPLPLEKTFELDIKKKYHVEQEGDVSYLAIEIAGGAYPPEDTVRGRRRAGGMALYVRGWTELEWRQTCSHLWKGWRVRLLPDGPVVILGYPYTRPSRPRCSLYACREAIRVACEWLTTINTKKAQVAIVTDSNYVVSLLQNSTKVSIWSHATSKDALVYDGPGKRYEANPDILYPLSISLKQLTKQRDLPIEKRKDVVVNFKTSALDDDFRRVRDGAQLAAKLMYDSVR